jgi:hypothetical protein
MEETPPVLIPGPGGLTFTFTRTFRRKPVVVLVMLKLSSSCLLGLALVMSGCSGANGLTVGTDPDAQPNGSYSGYTLNSPVTDQNPHPGGDASYPSSVSDQGVTPPPPDKSDGR